jgi:hypothetical protein
MKKKSIICAAVLALAATFAQTAFASATPETNLGGVNVYTGESVHISDAIAATQPYVTYADGSKENVSHLYVGLFINGSIVKNSNLIVENNRTLLPLRLVSETLGATVDWNDAQRKVTITDGGTKIELIIGQTTPTVNGAATEIDVAPKIYNNYTYVPVRFVAEALSCKVDYFDGRASQKPDGTGVPQAYYFFRLPQVMISRYSAAPLSSSEAVAKAKEQLITAYENKFGKFEPLASFVPPSGAWNDEAERDSLRAAITNLAVTSENDRFIITHATSRDFWIDKYTGSVFVFYNGNVMTIYPFDPNAQDALSFAG